MRFLSRPATVEPKSSRGEQRPRRLDLTCPEPRFSWFGLYGLYGETVVTNAVCVILFYPFLTLRIHTPFPRWTPLTHFATALLQIPRYFSRWWLCGQKCGLFEPPSRFAALSASLKKYRVQSKARFPNPWPSKSHPDDERNRERSDLPKIFSRSLNTSGFFQLFRALN